jgi:hypothetical protein
MMPPYVALLDLAQQFQRNDSDAAGFIVEFVGKWGLLGIVPTFAVAINFPGRALPDSTDGEVSKEQLPTTFEQVRYARFGGHWIETLVTCGIRTSLEENRRVADPGVSWLGWSGRHTYSSAHKGFESLKDFIPGRNPEEVFPRPDGPDFFRFYAEPVPDVYQFAKRFLEAVSLLCGDKSDEDPTLYFSTLAQGAAPSFARSPHGVYLEESRTSASLLSSFALMFLWDRAAGRRALRCQECGRFFVSDDRRAAYCSRSHRLTASSRRFRAKKDAEKASPKEPNT